MLVATHMNRLTQFRGSLHILTVGGVDLLNDFPIAEYFQAIKIGDE